MRQRTLCTCDCGENAALDVRDLKEAVVLLMIVVDEKACGLNTVLPAFKSSFAASVVARCYCQDAQETVELSPFSVTTL